jgi:uncharacterized protein (TIGR03382 family)
MNWPKLKSLTIGLGHTALVLGVVGGLVAGGEAAQAAVGNNPGAVNLNPTTGPTSSTPTWATTVGCNAGFQGSAVFRAVTSSGTTFSISGATNSVTAAFQGTLQSDIGTIQTVTGIPNGGTTELVVICFSGPSLTGNSDPEMDIFITFSADGSTYSTSTSNTTVPIGEIGGPIFAALAAIGLVVMQFRRRRRRAQPSLS